MSTGAGGAGFDAQAAIRMGATELNEYMSELFAWSKDMKRKQQQRPAAPPTVNAAAAAASGPAAPAPAQQQQQQKAAAGRHPAAHTYEHYRDKWDRFDVDAALAEEEEAEGAADGGGSKSGSSAARPASSSGPAAAVPQAHVTVPVAPVPPPATPAATPAAAAPATAEGWKDAGNARFRAGQYQAAADCYASSLALAPTCLAHANRAMALLKLGRHAEAEAECGAALGLDPLYVKAYQRRWAYGLALVGLCCASDRL